MCAYKLTESGIFSTKNGTVKDKTITWEGLEKKYDYGSPEYIYGGKYSGNVLDSMPSGNGTYTSSNNGCTYSGEWLKGRQHGKGVYFFKGHKSGGSIGMKYEGDWFEGKRHGIGKFNYTDTHVLYDEISTNVYEGDWVGGKMHGKGILKSLDKKIFEGEFINGKKHKGIEYDNKGNKLDGIWVDDVQKGMAVWSFSDGTFYEGEMSNLIPQGKGKLSYLDGETIEGSFDKGLPEGDCVQICYNGDKFEGMYKNGKKNGNGKYTTNKGYDIGKWENNKYVVNSGGRYEGEIQNGEKNGKGILYFGEGGYYNGDWINGKRDGKGINEFSGGDKYEGDFINDKLQGTGLYTFASGSIMDGEFKEGIFIKGEFKWNRESVNFFTKKGDKFTGTLITNKGSAQPFLSKGKMEYANGDFYDGNWEANKPHGKGIFIYANGDKYEGDFINDCYHGKGIFTFHNGEIYKGDYINHLRQGKGINTLPNGNKFEGEYFKNHMHGNGIFTDANGNKFEGQWNSGLITFGKQTNKEGLILYNGLWHNDECVSAKINLLNQSKDYKKIIIIYEELIKVEELKEQIKFINDEISKYNNLLIAELTSSFGISLGSSNSEDLAIDKKEDTDDFDDFS